MTIGKGKTGTIVKQSPKSKTKITKGSAVNIWLLKQKSRLSTRPESKMLAKNIKPKLFEKKKKLYMEFPREVQNVKVRDKNGKILQSFKKGRKFDITKSLKLTKAGNIKIYFTPAPKRGSGVPKSGPVPKPPIQYSELDHTIKLIKFNHLRFSERAIFTDSSSIDAGEPSNDSAGGATLLGRAGRYSGDVGGDSDSIDYLRFTTGASGYGTLVTISRISGSIELNLYRPGAGGTLAGDNNKVWIALKPNTTFNFSVEPSGTGMTAYPF